MEIDHTWHCDWKFLFLLLNDWRVGLSLGWNAFWTALCWTLTKIHHSISFIGTHTSAAGQWLPLASSDSCSEWSNSSRSPSWWMFSSTGSGVLFFEAGSIEKRVICLFAKRLTEATLNCSAGTSVAKITLGIIKFLAISSIHRIHTLHVGKGLGMGDISVFYWYIQYLVVLIRYRIELQVLNWVIPVPRPLIKVIWLNLVLKLIITTIQYNIRRLALTYVHCSVNTQQLSQ